MFGFARRPKSPATGVRFCDSCAEVTTTGQRAERRYDNARTAAYAAIGQR